MPKATSAVWSLFVHEKTRDVHHLQQSSSIERLDAPEPSNSTEFPVLDGKNSSSDGKLMNPLKNELPILNWLVYFSVKIDGKKKIVISSLTKISLKFILDAKITSISSDVNTIYRPIRLKFTLVDGILSNEISYSTSFLSLNLNCAAPFSLSQQF